MPPEAPTGRSADRASGQVPGRVGRYELITKLGQGGMATVYLARAVGSLRFGQSFERLAAVKVLHPHLAADEGFVEMFLHEARVASRIQHRNVVTTLDVGIDDGLLFMVMDYVEGDTLSAVQSTATALGRGVPLGIVLRVVTDALSGLHAAHELRDDRGESMRVVHRDVTPQNILLGVDGASRLTDFGIALARGRLTHTAEGMLKGKLAYMAPEQLEAAEVDRRVDVFAMGVTLWETLALRRLFPGRATYEQARRSVRAPYRPLREFHPGVPPELDDVIARAVAPRREDRYPTAGAFADDLEHRLGGAIADAREVGSFIAAVAREKLERERAALRAAAGAPAGLPEDERPTHHSVTVPAIPSARLAPLKALGAGADASVLEPIPLVPQRRREPLERATTLSPPPPREGGFFPSAPRRPDPHDESVTRELPPRAADPSEAKTPALARLSIPRPVARREPVRWAPLQTPPPVASDPHAWRAEAAAAAVLAAIVLAVAYALAR